MALAGSGQRKAESRSRPPSPRYRSQLKAHSSQLAAGGWQPTSVVCPHAPESFAFLKPMPLYTSMQQKNAHLWAPNAWYLAACMRSLRHYTRFAQL